MPRYRCIFVPQWGDSSSARPDRTGNRGPRTGSEAGSRTVLQIAYEFDAPDMQTLEVWLNERDISPSSVTAIHEVPADDAKLSESDRLVRTL